MLDIGCRVEPAANLVRDGSATAEKIVVGAIEAALVRARSVRRGASILIGLSGGADSVALTRALLELREGWDSGSRRRI